MKHVYAIYMIEIATEIERRKANDSGLPLAAREKAQRLLEQLAESRGVLERDAATKPKEGA